MNRKFKFILILLSIVFLVSCAGMSEMTAPQKHLTYRTMFNNILDQFNGWAFSQPEETKIKLRKDVVPLIDEAKDALDLYEKSLSISTDDPDARLNFYLDLKTKLINLIASYGLKVEEKKGGGI